MAIKKEDKDKSEFNIRPHLLVGITLFLLYFGLHRLIVGLFEPFVQALWSKIDRSVLLDVLVVGTVIYLIQRTYQEKRLTKHLIQVEAILITCTIIYLYERFWGEQWVFLKTSFIETLAYFDLLVLLPVFLGIRLRANARKPKTEKPGFLEDNPIDGSQEADELGYFTYASSLAKRLEQGNYQASFSLGICGTWGSGKTSFVRMLHRQFDSEKIIWVEFQPWLSGKAPFEAFFKTIEAASQKVSPSLSHLISQYARALEPTIKSTWLKLGIDKLALNDRKKTQQEYLDEIGDLLLRINRKMIIVIDDLDRLEKDEIITLLKIIRNTANFKNAIFIGLYDKQYLSNMLKEYSIKGSTEFSDKVFQLEVQLPRFKKEVLSQNLCAALTEKFPEMEQEFKAVLVDKNSPYASTFTALLKSKRDVTKLANAFILNYSQLPGELNVKDLLLLELLKLRNYALYAELREHRERHLTEGYSESNAQTFHHYSNQVYNPIWIEPAKGPELSIEQEEIKNLLNAMFDLLSRHDKEDFPKASISYPSHYDRYFYLSMNETAYSEKDWIQLRKKRSVEFLKEIQKGLKSEKAHSLTERLFKVKGFDNAEDFKKIIQAQLMTIDDQRRANDQYGPRLSLVVNTMEKHTPKISGDSHDPFQTKLLTYDLIEEYELTNSLKFNLLARLRNYKDTWESGKLDRLESYIVQDMLKGKDKFPDGFWETVTEPLRKQMILIKKTDKDFKFDAVKMLRHPVVQVIKGFALKKDIKGLLEGMIPSQTFGEGNLSVIVTLVHLFFGGMDEFKQFLEEKGTLETKEMLAFLNHSEKNEGPIQLPFEFKTLKPKGAVFLK